MAQRDKVPKRSMERAGKPAVAGTESLERLETRCRSLEHERDSLTAELERARARIAALESARDDVVNRIDWIVDSLHTLKQGGE